MLALIYLDRVIHRNPGFVISTLNIHRLLVTSLMTAAKFFDDIYYNNGYYARVGGVSNQEMNALELEFLYMINFSLHVSVEEFERYQQELLGHAANEQPCHCAKEEAVQMACQHICEEALLEDEARMAAEAEAATEEEEGDYDCENDSEMCMEEYMAEDYSPVDAVAAMDLDSDMETDQAQDCMVDQFGGALRKSASQPGNLFVSTEEDLGRDIARTASASSVESYASLDSRNSDLSDTLVHPHYPSSAPVSRHSSPAIFESEPCGAVANGRQLRSQQHHQQNFPTCLRSQASATSGAVPGSAF